MRNLKKALSVFLCAVMLFTTLCFFSPVSDVMRAEAAVVNEGSKTAFYVPETIYLYPDVTSRTNAVSTPFQYYVNNTVDVNNIYSAPVAEANLDSEGKIYFASEEGMSDISLSVKFLYLSGAYMAESAYGTVSFTTENMGDYVVFTVTDGVSPSIAAAETGCYIEWCVSYKNDLGEMKAAFNYTYVYKPFVSPYGAAARVYNEKGDVNVYGQHITWVTGVHSIDTTPAQTNTLYPYYMPISSEGTNQFAFSPFLSKDNKAYVGTVEVSGAAPVANGSYNAVFSGTEKTTAYFHAGQLGASFDTSEKVRAWFATYAQDITYTAPFDYYNGSAVSAAYALSQVTPTKIGAIKVDVSRYSNLNEIPNLAVGMMVVDVDYYDALSGSTAVPTAQWYVGDATGLTHSATGAYDTKDALTGANEAVNTKFAYEKNLTSPLTRGIVYAGAWDKALNEGTGANTYTVKGYYESIDRELDRQAASAAVNLTVNQIDKSALREAVYNAGAYMGALGVKANWNSLYYDTEAIDADTGTSAWERFEIAFRNAAGVLGNIDGDYDYAYFANELNTALNALLEGEGLKVFFDVNYDDIGINLFIPSNEKITSTGVTYAYNSENEAISLSGTDASGGTYFSRTPFTPKGPDAYTVSMTKLSGSVTGQGCTVLEPANIDNSFNLPNDSGATKRFNFDNYSVSTAQMTITFSDGTYKEADKFMFRTWYDTRVNNPLVFTDITLQIKIEEGSTKTAYSPAGKVVSGAAYGTLPAPTREGYTFAGWYTDEALTNAVNSESAVSARVLYAKWDANEYSLGYDNLFSVNEMALHSGSMTMNKENSSVTAKDGVITITANGTVNGDVYATEGKSANHYNIPVEPSTEYVLSYDLDISDGGGSQVILFFFNDVEGDNTKYVASDVTMETFNEAGESYGVSTITSSPHSACYVHNDRRVVIRFTTNAEADLLSIRFGSANSTNTVTTFSNIRLSEAETYDLVSWDAVEKSVPFDAEGYGELLVPTKEGYVFAGWYTGKNGTGEYITSTTPVKSENITVYSHWTANQYTVAFDGNTGLGGIGVLNATFDEPFNLPANQFEKEGYTFIGWATSPDIAPEYEDEENVVNLTNEVDGSVTLYAIWQANTFTVHFDNNTGEGEMADASVVYESGATLPECEFNKTGYTFIGWSTTPDGAVILTDEDYDLLKTEEGDEITLYAIWSENSYTLSFDKNGGTGENITPTVYGYETQVTLPKNVFTKTGYILAGWSLTKGGEMVYENGATVNHINPDKNGTVTLYAVWTPVEYTIKLDSNSGSGTMADIAATYDTDSVLTENTFTKEGYHFLGWAETPDGSVIYNNGATVKNLTSTDGAVVTLYAVWEINTYTVTFSYYNTYGVYVNTPVTVTHGSDAVPPSDFTSTPYMNEISHYVFSGWSKEITNITGDLEVSAKYPSSSIEAHTMTSDTHDSTCMTEGYTKYNCTKCSYEYIETISLKEHVWDEGTVTTKPGCVTSGTLTYSCVNCITTKAEAISPTGHSFTNVAAKEATCKEEGLIAHKHCDNCEKCFSTDASTNAPDSQALTTADVTIAKLPHTPGSEATCTENQICTVCGEILVNAFGHTEVYEYITTDATCIKIGTYTEKVTCSVCGILISETAKTGYVPHTYTSEVTAPTCTEVGYTTHTCTVCGDNYTDDEVPATGHTEGEWVLTTAPTCTEKGTETNMCSVCSVGFKTREVAAEGHDSGAWNITTPAKCEEWGVESLQCTKCGAVITTRGISPKGHGETKTEITLEAGCETAGRESTICVDCGKELSFSVIPETGHKPDSAATCEKDSICLNCGEVLAEKTGHNWNSGVVTKEPTETEEGVMTYTCLNDPTHTYTESIPVLVIITLPEIPSDGTYDMDGDETGYAGNINDIVSVKDGYEFTATSSDVSVVAIGADGSLTVRKDGNVIITIKTTDGKYEKSFTVSARVLRTISFDVRGELTTITAYAGDNITALAPVAEEYEENGFTYRFKCWTADGTELSEVIVTGDMTLVAKFTSSCDYSELDRLEVIFNDVISGNYDNGKLLEKLANEIEEAKALIAEFKADRDTRDSSEQGLVDAAADIVSALVAQLYPMENATIEIRGNDTLSLGSVTEITAYLMPLDTKITNGVWTSSDDAVGFFSNGKFYAVSSGTVTITVTSGSITATKEITITGATYARVIMFDTLVSDINYIVENSLIIDTTTNMFWAPDAPVHFRVIAHGTFEEYFVYIDNEIIYPDMNGVYTIPANTGDVHVRVAGVVNDPDQSGQKMSFWDMILDFFRKIAEFFRNLFSFG